MSLPLIILLLHLQVIHSGFAQVCTKTRVNSCKECIQSGPHCAWCKKLNFTTAGEPDSARCDTVKVLTERGCIEADIINPDSTASPEDKGTVAQLKPEQVDLELRPGKTGEFEVTFRRAKDYSVDLYYLMDLSFSMYDDLQRVKRLGADLLKALNSRTTAAQIGFGSFVDKTVLPFVSTHPEQLKNPCPDKKIPCQSPFSFKHILTLTPNGATFEQEVGKQSISGNLDSPEGGLDAMMQVAVCGDKIGWRNVTRLLVYATDDGFHIAGDGKLAAILTPNDGKCHLENNMYEKSNEFDYPSVGQLAQMLSKNNIQVVFAVTSNMVKTYEDLSRLIPKSVVGTLSEDSNNVVALITDAYKNLSSEVILDHGVTPDDLVILYDSHCSDGVSEVGKTKGVCSGVKINEEIKFKVKVTAQKCLPDQNITIRALGFTDKVEVRLRTVCDCKCNDEAERGACNAKGKVECGICSCYKGYVGKNCECVTGGKTNQELEQSCRKDNSSAVCSGVGECICGQCTCNPNDDPAKKIYGQYCQCDNFNCEMFDSKVCGGQGTCDCGNCICNADYEGTSCQCRKSTLNCRNIRGSICSGRGKCVCNKCTCKPGYIGLHCDTCPGCPSQCPRFGPCVECYIKQGEKSSGNCTQICPGVTAEIVEQIKEETFCKEKDSENCWMQFVLQEKDGEDQYIIKYTLKRECPEAPNLFIIVGSTIGGVLLIGLICLLIWKFVTEIKDRKEYQRFEKEKQKAKWKEDINPIFSNATTTVMNPHFDGE